MASNLEVFLISSYYQRRRGATAGVRVYPSGPVSTILRNYQFTPSSVEELPFTLKRFHWLVNKDIVNFNTGKIQFDLRVSYSHDALLNSPDQPMVIIGDFSEGMYHYTMQIWDCNQITLELTNKLYEAKISSPQAFWLLRENYEYTRYCDPLKKLHKRSGKLTSSSKCEVFNRYKEGFRLVFTKDFLFFEDAFGKGVNFHWRASVAHPNLSVHLHPSLDEIPLSMIMLCFYQQKEHSMDMDLVHRYTAQSRLIDFLKFACGSLQTLTEIVIRRICAQLIMLIVDYFVKPLVPDWDIKVKVYAESLAQIKLLIVSKNGVEFKGVADELNNENIRLLQLECSLILKGAYKPMITQDPWRKSLEQLELSKLKDWYLNARNPQHCRSQGLLWRFKMSSTEFFSDFFCQHLSTNPAKARSQFEEGFNFDQDKKLAEDCSYSLKIDQKVVLIKSLSDPSKHFNYDYAIDGVHLFHKGNLLVVHQAYQDGQYVNLSYTLDQKYASCRTMGFFLTEKDTKLNGYLTATGAEQDSDYLLVCCWKDKQPLGECLLGAFNLIPRIESHLVAACEHLQLNSLSKLAETDHQIANFLEGMAQPPFLRCVTYQFRQYGVYRIVYHDDDVTQKWVLVCLEVSFNRKAFQFKNRGFVKQEGPSTGSFVHTTIVKGFLLKHGLIVLQMETDYTLTVFSMQKHKLVMSHKFSNHSALVRDRLQLDPSMAVSIYSTSKGNKVMLCMVYTGPKGQKATVDESKHQPWLIRVVPLCFK